MNGLKINNITLFVGYLPNRKQACFYFQDGASIYPVAYIKKERMAQTVRLWETMLNEEVKRG